ncbi:MAG: hypothetical protein M1308_23650 [Actinobacteria bacterium]|nr:hypothetical protein [Actinomycetota bacterium]
MMKYSDKLTENIIFGESWSTKIINGKEIKRQVPPDEKYIPDILITAQEGQKIRDKLNEVYDDNMEIGYRNKLNEIMLIIDSFWRQLVFQLHLFLTEQSTTKTGDHPKGKAIDLLTPRGMTANQFYLFIKEKCNTKFTKFIVYNWGVHCARK